MTTAVCELGDGSPAPTLKDALKFWLVPSTVVVALGLVAVIAGRCLRF